MSTMHQARAGGGVHVLEHSLVAAKMSVLRDKTTAAVQFLSRAGFQSRGQRPRLQNYELGHEEHSSTAPHREEQSPLLKLFRQRHLIDDQVAALFKVMDFNPLILG
jgi:hypothetical protein